MFGRIHRFRGLALLLTTTLIWQSLLTGMAVAQEEEKINMGLYDIRSIGVSSDTAATLTEVIRNEVFKTGMYEMLAEEDVESLVKTLPYKPEDCESDKCISEIFKAKDVKLIITGSVSKLGVKYIISLRLIDVDSAGTINNSTEECFCIPEQLTDKVRQTTRVLLGLAPQETVSTAASSDDSGKKPLYKRWWAWVLAILVTGGIIAAASSASKNDDGDDGGSSSNSGTAVITW